MEEKVKSYIEAVIALSKGYGMSIGHQDSHGAFEIVPYSPHYDKWLRNATIEITEEDNPEVNNYEI